MEVADVAGRVPVMVAAVVGLTDMVAIQAVVVRPEFYSVGVEPVVMVAAVIMVVAVVVAGIMVAMVIVAGEMVVAAVAVRVTFQV